MEDEEFAAGVEERDRISANVYGRGEGSGFGLVAYGRKWCAERIRCVRRSGLSNRVYIGLPGWMDEREKGLRRMKRKGRMGGIVSGGLFFEPKYSVRSVGRRRSE